MAPTTYLRTAVAALGLTLLVGRADAGTFELEVRAMQAVSRHHLEDKDKTSTTPLTSCAASVMSFARTLPLADALPTDVWCARVRARSSRSCG